jgi:uncharacterized protein GlcG (DUF336 family)
MKHAFVTVGLSAALFSASLALGQTSQDAGQPRAPIAPIDPAALPGDFVDATIDEQLHVPLGPPQEPRPSAASPSEPTTALTLNLAFDAAKTAVEACGADGYKVSVAVTDAAGHLKAALAADGVAPNRVYMALRKDITAAAFGISTVALREKIAADPSLLKQLKPNMSVLPGGMPILVEGRVVGAIASSGAFAYEEEKCVRAGLQEIQAQLK